MEALFLGLGGGREGGEEGRVEVERRSARLGFRVRRETKCLSLRSFSLSLSLTAREAPRGRRRQPWRFRPFLSLERRKKDEEAIELVFDAQYSSVRKRVRKRASEFFSLSSFHPLFSRRSLLAKRGVSPPSLSHAPRAALALALSPSSSLLEIKQQKGKAEKGRKQTQASVFGAPFSKKRKKRKQTCFTPPRSWPRRARWAPSGSRRTWTGGSSGRRFSRPTSRRASVSLEGWSNSMSNSTDAKHLGEGDLRGVARRLRDALSSVCTDDGTGSVK